MNLQGLFSFFSFPSWQRHLCKFSVSNCLHHSLSMHVPAVIKPAAPCAPRPQITRDVWTGVQKDLIASREETPVPAGKRAGRQLFEPCGGEGGKCKAPCDWASDRPLCTQQHPPHPITHRPSQQTEGEMHSKPHFCCI